MTGTESITIDYQQVLEQLQQVEQFVNENRSELNEAQKARIVSSLKSLKRKLSSSRSETSIVELVVPGDPVAQPRHSGRIVGKGKRQFVQMYIPGKHPIHDYKERIQQVVPRDLNRSLIDQPVMLDVEFVFPRHKTKTWKTKAMNRYLHQEKPDFDNLLKAVGDALNGHAWVDDALVSKVSATKWRASGDEEARTEITIKPINVG